jgi:hypothetical protein
MTLGGWVSAPGHCPKSVSGQSSGFIWRKCAYFADRETARSAFLVAVLYKIGRSSTGLHTNAKALHCAVTRIPHEEVFAVPIGAQRINKTLSNLRHDQSFLLPRRGRPPGEAGGKHDGANSGKIE